MLIFYRPHLAGDRIQVTAISYNNRRETKGHAVPSPLDSPVPGCGLGRGQRQRSAAKQSSSLQTTAPRRGYTGGAGEMQTAAATPEPGAAVVACCRSGRGTERLASARPRELPAGAPSLASAATPESEAPGGEVTGEHDHALRHQGSRADSAYRQARGARRGGPRPPPPTTFLLLLPCRPLHQRENWPCSSSPEKADPDFLACS